MIIADATERCASENANHNSWHFWYIIYVQGGVQIVLYVPTVIVPLDGLGGVWTTCLISVLTGLITDDGEVKSIQ